MSRNPAAWDQPIPYTVMPTSEITGICRACGRALFGGPGGWYDVMGYENCPTPWPETNFHEPMPKQSGGAG